MAFLAGSEVQRLHGCEKLQLSPQQQKTKWDFEERLTMCEAASDWSGLGEEAAFNNDETQTIRTNEAYFIVEASMDVRYLFKVTPGVKLMEKPHSQGPSGPLVPRAVHHLLGVRNTDPEEKHTWFTCCSVDSENHEHSPETHKLHDSWRALKWIRERKVKSNIHSMAYLLHCVLFITFVACHHYLFNRKFYLSTWTWLDRFLKRLFHDLRFIIFPLFLLHMLLVYCCGVLSVLYYVNLSRELYSNDIYIHSACICFYRKLADKIGQ